MDLPTTVELRRPRLVPAAPESLPSPSLFVVTRIERALLSALHPGEAHAPPQLFAALRHALFPGGGRLRPKLCLAISAACGDPDPGLSDAAAAAVEMIHCASLVHDDLPCFDDADTRRGLPTVHRAFGESIAVLAGDQLIVLAFEHLARVAVDVQRTNGHPAAALEAARKLPQLVSLLARGAGTPFGLIAGQAWESEPRVDATLYRRAKTGALFEAAAAMGAAACGASPQAWAVVGARIGEAYQVADDILDVVGDADRAGKPVGQDATHGRPNAAASLGVTEARRLFDRLVREAIESIPACADPEPVRAWLREAERRARSML